MRQRYVLIIISFVFCTTLSAQIRPNVTVSQSVNASCGSCQILNPNSAWDVSISTSTELDVSLATTGGSAQVTYGFASPIPRHDIIRLSLRFGGGSILTGLASAEIFQRIRIQLQNNAGTALVTYNNIDPLEIDILSLGDNTFEITIVNPNATTQRINIQTGDLLGSGLISRDLFISDIRHIPAEIIQVTTAEGAGKVNSLLCILCTVINRERATDAFDMNKDFANFNIPLSLNLGSGYLYSRYSWGGTTFSGNDYDVYVVLQNSQLLTLGTELLFFDNENIAIEVEYSDGSSQVFKAGNSLIYASILGIGSGRFYLKINANNAKQISKVEVRFGGNLLDILNNLRLYSVFVSGNNPFIEPDIEAVYSLTTPKPVTDYVTNDVLATATDGNGTIISAVVNGSLPPGVALDSDGRIRVSNAAILTSGTFPLQITTTDIKGGTTVSNISLIIGPADIEAVYTVNPAKPVNDYSNGNTVATVTDANGPIVSAVVTTGTLPAGTAIAANGTITVSNAAALVPGTTPLQVTTTDNKGGITVSSISIIINPADIEAVYTVNAAKPVNDYIDNAALATVTDANGPIVSASVTSGTLPAGTTIAADGTITVSNPAGLIAGTFPIQVTTTDNKGGVTVSSISIIISPADIEAVYTVNPAKPVNDYSNGNTVATVTDADGPIVSAVVTTGTLPVGTAITANGTITVSNAAALVPGTTPLQVTTTDNKGGITVSSISIVINPTDIEAVYTVNPQKQLNDYSNGNTLATVTDANGLVISAVVTTGTLPPGTVIAADGTITVSNIAVLTAGTTPIQVTTTDDKGGITINSISIIIKAADVEAIYTVSPVKTLNTYANSDVLASVTDADGAIISAVITSGTLPAGTTIAANGTITVSNSTLLVAGSYPLDITTTDVNGGVTVSHIAIVLDPTAFVDIEAVYVVTIPKPANDYTNGNTLASVTDVNGPIVSAVVTTGTLPPGTAIAANGTITVSNAAALVAGTTPIQVTTTDDKGGVTVSSISIVINLADIEAVYTVNPAKPVNDYVDDAVLATVTDANGPIVSAVVTTGTLPAGTTLESDGTVKVTNPAILTPGTYTVQITTTDDKGGVTVSSVSIIINAADIEAVYVVNTPKPANDYTNGNTLASVTDVNGPIVSAVVTTGTLPPGTAIAANGTITVSNAAALVAGTTPIQVTTTDDKGGVTVSSISIVIHAADIEAVYTVNPAKPVNDYVDDAVLATVTDANGPIVSAVVTTGTLPAGTTLESDGTVKVTNPAILTPGTYTVQITTTDDKGGVTVSSVSIIINAADIEAVYVVNTPKPANDYTNGNTLASVTDVNGPIVSAVVTTGTLPPGTAIAANGTITVSNAAALVAGTTPIQVTTTDDKGGVTVSSISIVIHAADIEAVYVIAPAKTITDYVNNDVMATVTDANGPIVSAVVTTGTLPAGLVLNNNGSIVISDATQLVAGNYTLTITTTDSAGGTTASTITLIIPSDKITTGIAKTASSPILQADGSYLITYTILVENYGNVTINNIHVQDDLTDTFVTPATYTVLPGSVATGSFVINSSFDGDAVQELLASGSSLQPGATAKISFSVAVKLNGGPGQFSNAAIVTVSNDDNTLTYTDISDDGNNPDSNGNGNPNESGENDPTPVSLQPSPVLGVAKTAGIPLLKPDLTYDVQYTITLENLGNETLTNVQVADNLDNAFPIPATYSVIGNISVTGFLIANTTYDGSSDINLLAPGSTLAVGALQTITYKVNVDINGSTVPFFNQAAGSGNGSAGTSNDLSNNGSDPDPNGNGNPSDPGEDNATGVALTPNLVIGIAKNASIVQPQPDGSYRISYSIILENLGNVAINNITVTDNLLLAFPSPATYTLLPESFVANGTLMVNSAFDGASDVNLLTTGSSLAIGASHTISYAVIVFPNSTAGTFYNSARVKGVSDDGTLEYVDISDEGFDPDPNHNGDPTEPDENDQTKVNLTPNPIIGIAKAASIPSDQGDGEFMITYTITLENLGSVTLNDLRVIDNVKQTFPDPAEFSITAVESNGLLNVNPGFNGVTDTSLLAPGNSLVVGATQQIHFTVLVDPNGAGGVFTNSAYAAATGISNSGSTSDISANGFNPDPNGNSNPADIGEDDPTPVTLELLPVIGLAKSASVPILQSDDSYDVTFTFTLQNLGNTPLRNINLTDDLSLVFALPATFTVKNAPQASGSLVANASYNGTSIINLLNTASSELVIGATETVTVTLNVDAALIIDPFYNSAVVLASNPGNTLTYRDVSTNGLNPDPNGNGNPNDVGEAILTPVSFLSIPIIGIANEALDPVLNDDGTYNVTFTITVENLGNEPLTDIDVESSLINTFPFPMQVALLSAPVATGNLTVSTNFNGLTNTSLLQSGVLAIGETQTITYTVKITPNNIFGTFWQQPRALALGGVTTAETSDMSNNGIIVDSDRNGRADEWYDNEPTPVTLIANSSLGLSKVIDGIELQGNCTYNVTYLLTLQNFGNAELTDIIVNDDLAAVISNPATFSVVSVSASGDLNANPGFNGNTDKNLLLAGSTIDEEDTQEIIFTINIVPNGNFGPFTNAATVTATSPDGIIQDLSNDGSSDPDGNGNPEEDNPTILDIIPTQFFIPEGFSPNGDGVHDLLEINLVCGLTVKLSVYNRWGDKIFFSGHYQNNWDGYSNQGSFTGKAVPDGTYFYTAELSSGRKITSFFTIKR